MKALFFSLLTAMMLAHPALAQETPDESESGLALPRMVSLRSNLINARSGPGARYPIEWVYMQKGAPVEIVAEFELWRKIKDWQGSESWGHKSMLSGRRSIKMSTPGESNVYDKPDFTSPVIAKAEDEVIGSVKKCPANSQFCLINFGTVEGWVPRSNFYGVYPKEEIKYFVLHQANKRIIEAAARRLKQPIEKFPMNIDRYANTSSATIPILLDEINQKGMLNRGDKIVLSGFGGGLTWGSVYLTW